jgi:AraC-like DNA-binding protein
VRAIAEGGGWALFEYTCSAGPHDRPFEEQHGYTSIAAVVEGTFNYRSSTGSALLYPGAFLLGNVGACFECGHEHGHGDRSISLRCEPEFIGEIAATAAGSSRFRFPTAATPAARRLQAALANMEVAADVADGLACDELAIEVAQSVLAHTSGAPDTTPALSAHDIRRVADVLHHIERNSAEPLRLDDLAAVAGMSRFHFLRTFRHVTGVTPHAHVLALRLRRAALALGTTTDAVTDIAFDAGFGDLSTFNARFRTVFGEPPTRWRSRYARRRS